MESGRDVFFEAEAGFKGLRPSGYRSRKIRRSWVRMVGMGVCVSRRRRMVWVVCLKRRVRSVELDGGVSRVVGREAEIPDFLGG